MATDQKPLRLHGLVAENFKRLVVVDIKPDGSVIQITGKNGMGKTSVLDAISAALGGKSAEPAMPIRKGEEESTIKLDLGHLKVRKKFKKDKDGVTVSSLYVESADGAKFTGPQAVLNSLLGEISFDPLVFLRLKPVEQFNELRKFVPDFDFEKNTGVAAANYDKRTEANRDARRFRAQAEGIKVPDGLPEKPINEAALLKRMEDAAQTNGEIERERAARQQDLNMADTEDQRASDLKQQAEKLRAQAADLDKQAAALVEDAAMLRGKVAGAAPISAPVDVSEVRRELERAQAINAGLGLRDRRSELIADAEIKEAEAQTLTEQIEALEQARLDAIAKAKMPVEGLGFGDGIVALNGIPFSDASAAEQLRVSTAIAMHMNPKLRLILIKDGSLLDEDSMKLLAEIAEANDFQVVIERVDSSGKVGIVIEDGRVKGQAEAAE
jgi:DNA repair exonuclease SbcCD ATPase subunit